MSKKNVAKNVVVIGTQWGDEGKGKIVDWLTDNAQGVVRALLADDQAAAKDEAAIYALLRAKDTPGLEVLTANYAPATRAALLALPNLYGDIDVLARAREVLPPLPGIAKALAELAALAGSAIGRAEVAIDLADWRG